ncbi:hypothetical protein [Burkholderia glumae]|uniref:hypothetical protein n=1 Tax=Burkholderia glumae TaxID=337 RepID=UPI001AE4ACD7|nr:hypothetical protein [Burkholderia glumae]MCM2537943.1 hypothetical protein [Burkholderia glumae]
MGHFLAWIELHPGTASWVQAAGSIIALVFAIGVPAWQTSHARKAARKEAAERFRAVVQVVHLAFNYIGEIVTVLRSADHGKKYFETTLTPIDIRRLIGLMKTIEVKEMATKNAVTAFVAAQRACEIAILEIEGIQRDLSLSVITQHFSGSNPFQFAKRCEVVIECHTLLLLNLNSLLNECAVIEQGGESWSKRIAAIPAEAKQK